jgi:beta-glucanase (GH16 family)
VVSYVPGRTAQAAGPEWTMTWHDEFDGATVDPTKWSFETGTNEPGGPAYWGNNEKEYYTSRPENVAVTNSILHIKALKEAYGGMQYTSARMKTKGLFSQTYGRFEWRAALPLGQGLWPAMWMMPQNNTYGGWAASGEIDVVEAKGQINNMVQGTIFYGGAWPNQQSSTKTYGLPAGQTISTFHDYALEWSPTSIKWFVDDYCYSTKTSWYSGSSSTNLNAPYPAPFDQPLYIIMNLAVGGNYSGDPNTSTPFPAEMQVDYVRAYELPEPATLSLVAIGAAAALRLRRRRVRQAA